MTVETRQERYLRILEKGVTGENDYEDSKYLIDKGYLDGKYLLSKRHDSYGKVINVIAIGKTSNGIDFIDELREKIKASTSEPKENTLYKHTSKPTDSECSKSAESKISLYRIAEGVIIGVLVVFGGWIISNYLNIQL